MGVVGYGFNEGNISGLMDVAVTDFHQMQNRKAYIFAAVEAAHLQDAVEKDRITLEEAYRRLNAALREYTSFPDR